MNPSEELWISRALDRTATAADWRGLEAIAAADPAVWRRLGRTLQAEALLGQQLATLVPAAEVAADAVLPPALLATQRSARRSWLAAAVAGIAVLAFWLGRSSAPSTPASMPTTAGARITADADDAQRADDLLDAYIALGVDSGRVLEVLPQETIASRRVPGRDGVELVYLRSFVERAHVDRALTMAPDEHGRPLPLPVDLKNWIPPTNY